MTGHFTRRGFMQLTGLALGSIYLPRLSAAEIDGPIARPKGPQHGMSVFGDLKYPAGFSHFSYVNPDAPKGGLLSETGSTTAYNGAQDNFDTLNGYILKGNAAQRLDLNFDTLMVRAFDEPDAVYGLVAETAAFGNDGHDVIFTLREAARFHDGSKLTAEDVAFSLLLLKKEGHPLISQNMREVKDAIAETANRVRVTFSGKEARDLPLMLATLPIFSKAFYTANVFDKTTLVPPLGSGPYRIGQVEVSRSINYDRVEDYWARDLNVNRGRYNFARIRFEVFRDRTAEFEAFKAGQYLLREDFTAKDWATGYDFPAAKDGRVRRLTTPDHSPSGAQGWFINLRRAQFQDVRVREALSCAFDFQWMNKNLFYGAYTRTRSFFENSPLMAEGLPTPGELALLEPYRAQLPAAVFGEPVTPPVSDGSGQDRKLLRQAGALLDAAGWKVVDGVRQNAQGAPLEIEFLQDEPMWERICGSFIKNLKLLGVKASIRIVDGAQYQDRMKNYDFDLTVQRYSMSPTPGVEIHSFWGSQMAPVPGGNNLAGIADPVIDALIEKIIDAENREDQTVATHALDRVLRAGWYWVPQWFKSVHTLAFWDIYDHPAEPPAYDRALEDSWWVDATRAAKLGIGG
ncbi:MAG: extracellular solute-binding protein [Parvibaculaceae bacterium]|nr:extracellular solute-binding protein [Parvibaculaceae bacterium]